MKDIELQTREEALIIQEQQRKTITDRIMMVITSLTRLVFITGGFLFLYYKKYNTDNN